MTDLATERAAEVEPPFELVAPFEDPGFVDFARAGSEASGEFWCAGCGYGVVVQRALPPCPMCQGAVWERREPARARFAH
jgi:rubrerythrin